VPLDVPIRLAFNQAMDRARVEAAFTLSDAAGGQPRGAFTWNDDSTEVTFLPGAQLQYDTDYEVRLAANASAPSGSSLGSEFSLAFRTVGRPAVLSTLPAEGGQKGEWDGVRLGFAGPMDLASLRRALTISPAIENLGTWWNADDYSLSVYGDFDPSRSYTLNLAASAADPYGSLWRRPSTCTSRPATSRPSRASCATPRCSAWTPLAGP
jgi:hypothetical protein